MSAAANLREEETDCDDDDNEDEGEGTYRRKAKWWQTRVKCVHLLGFVMMKAFAVDSATHAKVAAQDRRWAIESKRNSMSRSWSIKSSDCDSNQIGQDRDVIKTMMMLMMVAAVAVAVVRIERKSSTIHKAPLVAKKMNKTRLTHYDDGSGTCKQACAPRHWHPNDFGCKWIGLKWRRRRRRRRRKRRTRRTHGSHTRTYSFERQPTHTHIERKAKRDSSHFWVSFEIVARPPFFLFQCSSSSAS